MKKFSLFFVLCIGLLLGWGCSSQSVQPGDDPYYDQPIESREDKKLNEEQEYLDETPSMEQQEDGDEDLEYETPPPKEYGE